MIVRAARNDIKALGEKLIRERGTHLASLMERATDPRVRPIVEQVMLGGMVPEDVPSDDISYVLDLGLLVEERGVLKPANPIYAETIGRYLSRRKQDEILVRLPENPWMRADGLDMAGRMAAFQQFWR